MSITPPAQTCLGIVEPDELGEESDDLPAVRLSVRLSGGGIESGPGDPFQTGQSANVIADDPALAFQRGPYLIPLP
jgi:hypothetical protein